jgi:hypothetical protein
MRLKSFAIWTASLGLIVLFLLSHSSSSLDQWASALSEGRSSSQHTVITYLEDLPRQVQSAASAALPNAAVTHAAAGATADAVAAVPAAAAHAAAAAPQPQQPQQQQQPPQPQQQQPPQPQQQPAAAAAAADAAPRVPRVPRWLQPEQSALAFNSPAVASLAAVTPKGSTLHFTFGSSVMMDFVKNWLHFITAPGTALSPYLVGAADAGLLKFCDEHSIPAAAIIPELDVWTYTRKPRAKGEVYEMKSDWKYFRHHNSDFLEMGLVKVAFLWELLSMGFSVLISDLDVVWLNGHWQRWMTWADAANPPVKEGHLIALADVLVTTDELSAERDARGGTPGMGTDLNTGVVYFRGTNGSLAMVQEWRKAMLRQKGRKDLNENVNDQSLFNQVVRGPEVRVPAGWTASLPGSASRELRAWRASLAERGALVERAFEQVITNY